MAEVRNGFDRGVLRRYPLSDCRDVLLDFHVWIALPKLRHLFLKTVSKGCILLSSHQSEDALYISRRS